MKVEVKKVDAIKRELKFEISKERVKTTLEEVYKDLAKYAKVKGFRQGKVPRQVLESEHGKFAQDEAIKKLIPETYQEAIKEQNIAPIDMPEIHDVSLKDGMLTFIAKLDIRPEVKIKDYKGIKVARKSSQVTDEELNKTLEFFKKGQGQDKEVAIDDAFAKGLGYPSLEEFKNVLKRQMEMDKDRHNRLDVENQIIDDLLKKATLTVPDSLVKKNFERRLTEWKQRSKEQGAKEEDIKKHEPEAIKNLQESAAKDVRVYLILEKIAEEEKIEAKENENLPAKTIEFLLKQAQWQGV